MVNNSVETLLLDFGGGIRYPIARMKTLGSQIREARLRRHLSQSALARQVGCKQSALSMYEGGRAAALSAETVGKLCAALGLLPPTEAELAEEAARPQGTRVYCPNPDCPSNLPVRVGESVVLVPHGHLAQEGEVHCAWCGEVLERACPECGAPLNAGAHCVRCGTAYLAGAPEHFDAERAAASERVLAWSR